MTNEHAKFTLPAIAECEGLTPRAIDMETIAYKRTGVPIRERISRFSNPIELTGCIEWTGSLNRLGYGVIHVGGRTGKTRAAHRVAWEEFVGLIPEGLCVCHKCDNRKCIAIGHLFLGTHQENMRDAANKKRLYCRPQKGEQNVSAKLNSFQVRVIRKLCKFGYKSITQRQIGKIFSVSRHCIVGIMYKGNWAHIPS